MKDLFQDGDYTGLHTVARSLVNLQTLYGMIPNVYGQGSAAQIVDQLTNTLIKELDERRSPINHQIGHLVLIDRNVDYVTPNCSQVRFLVPCIMYILGNYCNDPFIADLTKLLIYCTVSRSL